MGPSCVRDDVFDNQEIAGEGGLGCCKGSHEGRGGGCLGMDNQIGGGSPFHTHHTDMQMFWGILEGGVNIGHKVHEGRVAR